MYSDYVDIDYEFEAGSKLPLRVYGTIKDGTFSGYEVKVIYCDAQAFIVHEICDISESLKEEIYIDIIQRAEKLFSDSEYDAKIDKAVDSALYDR